MLLKTYGGKMSEDRLSTICMKKKDLEKWWVIGYKKQWRGWWYENEAGRDYRGRKFTAAISFWRG
jgi:hypothetical protein